MTRNGDGEAVAVPSPGQLQGLVMREMPRLELDSTTGRVDLHELARHRLVLFVYPHATGLPEPPVPDWDLIPGARGCTAQSCGFRDQYHRLRGLGAEVAGLSVQTLSEQREFAARIGLPYRLISDPNLALAGALGLPSFTASGRTFYRRLALLAESGLIVEAFDPTAAPGENAAEIVARLASRADERTTR